MGECIMHECLLCERDMKRSKDLLGKGCINNIFKFLEMPKPARGASKEQILYRTLMKKTHISRINSNQKIWLTDRYLTYQYLDKINYGDFDNIKRQINTDIQNVNKVSKLEELKTAGKIKLKQAYDLYKKAVKFQDGINELKKGNFTDEESFRLLIANCSFIFNMGKNKSQYEKSAFRAMQYAFWQTVIEVGGRYFQYELAAQLLQHSLEKNPQEYLITNEQILQLIIDDKNFKDKMNQIIDNYGDEKAFYIPLGEESLTFENNDLYFAIHIAKIEMKAEQDENICWNIDITLSDTFDFTKWKMPLEYYFDTNNIPKSLLSSTLYNLAYISQKLGVIKEYEVVAKLRIKIQKNGEIEKV